MDVLSGLAAWMDGWNDHSQKIHQKNCPSTARDICLYLVSLFKCLLLSPCCIQKDWQTGWLAGWLARWGAKSDSQKRFFMYLGGEGTLKIPPLWFVEEWKKRNHKHHFREIILVGITWFDILVFISGIASHTSQQWQPFLYCIQVEAAKYWKLYFYV